VRTINGRADRRFARLMDDLNKLENAVLAEKLGIRIEKPRCANTGAATSSCGEQKQTTN